MSRVLRDVYAGSQIQGAESIAVAVAVVGAVFSVLFAAGLTVLAIFNNRGKQGSRITTWVVGGLALCCNGFAVLGNAATRSMTLDSGSNSTGPSSAEVERQLNAALPSWYNGATVTLALIALLCLLGAIILLALPASNAFFRKVPAAGFDPLYGGGDGPQPPYPQAPYGQAPYGQPRQPSADPPYPQAPGQPTPGAYGPPASDQPGQVGPGQPPATDPWSAPPPPPPGSMPPGSMPPGSTPPPSGGEN